MFVYEKRLQYPVKIKNTNPKLASLIISQYGGPDSIRLQKSGAYRPGFSISQQRPAKAYRLLYQNKSLWLPVRISFRMRMWLSQ